jgi:hypothetical protein
MESSTSVKDLGLVQEKVSKDTWCCLIRGFGLWFVKADTEEEGRVKLAAAFNAYFPEREPTLGPLIPLHYFE